MKAYSGLLDSDGGSGNRNGNGCDLGTDTLAGRLVFVEGRAVQGVLGQGRRRLNGHKLNRGRAGRRTGRLADGLTGGLHEFRDANITSVTPLLLGRSRGKSDGLEDGLSAGDDRLGCQPRDGYGANNCRALSDDDSLGGSGC